MNWLKAALRAWLEVPHLPLVEEDQATLQEAQIELEWKVSNLSGAFRVLEQRVSKRGGSNVKPV